MYTNVVLSRTKPSDSNPAIMKLVDISVLLRGFLLMKNSIHGRPLVEVSFFLNLSHAFLLGWLFGKHFGILIALLLSFSSAIVFLVGLVEPFLIASGLLERHIGARPIYVRESCKSDG